MPPSTALTRGALAQLLGSRCASAARSSKDPSTGPAAGSVPLARNWRYSPIRASQARSCSTSRRRARFASSLRASFTLRPTARSVAGYGPAEALEQVLDVGVRELGLRTLP